MVKSDFENKSLVLIIHIGYILNLLFSWFGFFSIPGSGTQILNYQIGNAFAISASVMAGRYTGLRGQHVAASGYILLGIAHGISLAALGKGGIIPDKEATMAIPMIPALIFMLWCNIYPKWLRIFALVPSIFFILVFVHVHLGDTLFGLTLYSGYGTLQMNEVLWGIFLFRDWKQLQTKK